MIRHRGCGGELGEHRVCTRCGQSLQVGEVLAEPGPAPTLGRRRSGLDAPPGPPSSTERAELVRGIARGTTVFAQPARIRACTETRSSSSRLS